jgi:type IV pilus assembly protein PilB
MEAMPEEIRLGQHLIRSGAITEAQLEEALEIQRDLGGKLGRILIKLGYIGEEELLKHLSKRLEIEAVRLGRRNIPPALWRMISENTIRTKKVVPVSLANGMLTVAMASPQDLETVEEIKFETGENVVAVLASEKDIDEAIALFFGPPPETIEVPEEMKSAMLASSAIVVKEQTPPPPSPEAVKEAIETAATKEAREGLLRFPTRLKLDALIIALLDSGAVNEDTLNRLIRERAKEE